MEDALAWGAHLVPASHPDPVGASLALVPADARVAFCLDVDAIDPSAMPAVIAPTAGGLAYAQVLALLRGLAPRLASLSVVELMPVRDPHGLGAALAAQLVAAALSLLSAP